MREIAQLTVSLRCNSWRRNCCNVAAPSVAGFFAARIRAECLPQADSLRDKLRRYRNDPVGFARDVLSVRLWKRQRDLLEAIRDHDRVAAVSGHKIGKSLALACAALWFYCCWPKSRVIVTSKTERQVDGIIWKEVRWLVMRAQRNGWNLPGADEIHLVARSGLQDAEEFSEIFGFTAREVEAVAGISAPYMLWLVDEASGVEDRIYEAIFGNMMGGAKIAMISNPTRSEGEFARAFLDPQSQYYTLEISALETPNCTGEEDPIPGLADPDTIELARKKWGEDSPQYKVRVLGKFVIEEEGKLFPSSLRLAATELWQDNADSEPEGALVIGLDPAGDSGEGDESSFAPRRGNRLLELRCRRGLSHEAHALIIRELLKDYATPGELVPLLIDRDGPIGYRLVRALRAELEDDPVRIIAVRSSNKAQREPHLYNRLRDELFANLRDKMRIGEVELPADAMLDQELAVPELTPLVTGKYQATDKKKIREALGRSPDRLDSVCLAFWWRDGTVVEDAVRAPTSAEDLGALDPFEAQEAATVFDGGFDPYGSML